MANTAEMAQKDDHNNNNDNIKRVDMQLLSLKWCKEWLEQQRLDYEAELHTMRKMEQEELEGHNEPNIEELHQSILHLQDQLLDVSSTHSIKQYTMERLLSSYVTVKKLFSRTDGETGERTPDDEEFICQCEELLVLSKDIQKYQQALGEEQATLKDVQGEREEVKTTNANLMAELQQLQAINQIDKTEKESKAESSLREKILEWQNMVKVASNICQAAIFGSGVDWAQDEEVMKMVLSFGRPVNLLDT